MEPINFPEANTNLGRPAGWDESQCSDMRVYRDTIIIPSADNPLNDVKAIRTIQLWRPSQEEKEQIDKEGFIWVQILGNEIPPLSLFTQNPFIIESRDLTQYDSEQEPINIRVPLREDMEKMENRSRTALYRDLRDFGICYVGEYLGVDSDGKTPKTFILRIHPLNIEKHFDDEKTWFTYKQHGFTKNT